MLTAVDADIVVLTLLVWLAFSLSRTLQRRKVPELIGFIVAGIVIGPSGVGLLGDADLERLQPITEFALAALMFLVGERLSFRALRAARWVPAAGAISYVLAGTLVGAAAWLLDAEPVTVLLLAVLAGAGAPMTVASVAASAKARGPMASGLVGAHAVSDSIAALGFAFALPLAGLIRDTDTVEEAIRQSLRLGLGAVGLGVVFGILVLRMGRRVESSGDFLLLALVHLLLATTIAGVVGVALPLTALVMGATVAGSRQVDISQRVFASLRALEQPLYLVFFALAGISIHLDEVAKLGLVGVAYVLARTAGKIGGGLLGGLLGGLGPRVSFRIGADLLPQAGVAVALAVLATETLGDDGRSGAAIVLGSVVLFELAGPLVVARSFRHLPSTGGEGVDERLPEAVLLATMGDLEIPAWILDWCSRTGAELTVLGPGPGRRQGDDSSLDLLRRRCADEGIPLHWRALDDQTTFSTDVVNTAADIGADLTAVVMPSTEKPEEWLRSGAVESLPERLEAPVVLLPGRSMTAD